MKKILLSLVVFYIALIVLMPKKELYYTLNDVLKSNLIEISQKSLHDKLFFLEIKDVELYYDKAKVADIKKIDIIPFIFFNKATILNIELADSVKNILNFKAKELKLTYNIFGFSKIYIASNGTFGELEGEFDLKSKKLFLKLTPSKEFENDKNINKFFKKTENGYIHESSI